MTRTNVVTGAASGIGKATAQLLASRGENVITVDIHNADITADLSTEEGRNHYVEHIHARTAGKIDAVYAIAGLALPEPATIAVNYFGALATITPLHDLLVESDSPRVVLTSSIASYMGYDEPLLNALLHNDEPYALQLAQELAADDLRKNLIYGTSKHALTRWIRANAVKDEWAGRGIAVNGVAPGLIRTPMTQDLLANDESRTAVEEQCPAPYHGPVAQPEWIASTLAFLGSPDNMFITGQVLFTDGGAEALARPELV
ncbi:SDR family oxidoreductase [Timonella sp. A28]|uniref:SDR family oxidoreductase n=1 Tax=Timonella sp. A28 TaxID=3442640 RepID=UPI003EB813F9